MTALKNVMPGDLFKIGPTPFISGALRLCVYVQPYVGEDGSANLRVGTLMPFRMEDLWRHENAIVEVPAWRA